MYSMATPLRSGSTFSIAAGAISQNGGRFRRLGSESLFWVAAVSVEDAVSATSKSIEGRRARVGVTGAGDCV